MADHAISNYLQNHIFDYITNGVTYTRYLALSVTLPTAAGSFTEVSGSGYARTNIYNGTTTTNAFPAYDGTSGYLANNQIISSAKATGTWTQANYWVIMSALTSGSMLAYGRIYPGIVYVNNDYAIFPVGSLIIRIPAN